MRNSSLRPKILRSNRLPAFVPQLRDYAQQAPGMTKEINHEAHEGKEFAAQNGVTVCHTIVTWQFSPFSL
jgi:hypothetical protein